MEFERYINKIHCKGRHTFYKIINNENVTTDYSTVSVFRPRRSH